MRRSLLAVTLAGCALAMIGLWISLAEESDPNNDLVAAETTPPAEPRMLGDGGTTDEPDGELLKPPSSLPEPMSVWVRELGRARGIEECRRRMDEGWAYCAFELQPCSLSFGSVSLFEVGLCWPGPVSNRPPKGLEEVLRGVAGPDSTDG